MKLIPLSQRGKNKDKFYAMVDDEDFNFLNQWKWCCDKFYAIRHDYTSGKQIKIFMHRLLMKTPKNLLCDHKDHNGLNNQKSNLRNCNSSQNQINSIGTGKSKYLGVGLHIMKSKYLSKKYGLREYINKKWIAHIKANGKYFHLGIFSLTEEGEIEAAKAYDKAAKIYHGEFANLNFK